MRRPVMLLALFACNQPPEGLSVAITPEVPGTADPLVAAISTEATDPNGDAVEIRYLWRRDGETVDVTTDTVPASLTSRGEVWELVATPFDGATVGASASAEVTIANTLPTGTVSLTPQDPQTDDDLNVTVNFTDPDGEIVDVTYQWYVDGTATNGQTRIDDDRTEKGQIWEVVVTPSDSEGVGEPVSASVTIGNTAPVVSRAAISPERLDRTSTATCEGKGWQDLNGDPEGYNVTWQVDGAEVSTQVALGIAPYAEGSSVTCTLTPFDGETEGAPVTSQPVVVGNAAPTVGSVVIGPADPRTGTLLTSEITDVADLDGDAVALRYSWTIDGVPRATTAELPGNRYVGGQTIVLLVTPFDGDGDGPVATSNTLVAANSPPVVSEVVLSPVDPDTEDDVVATVTARDADGHAFTLTYDWTVNGTSAGVSGDTLSGLTDFDKHDEIEVTVTASDTEDGTPVTSDAIFAVNTPPPAPVLVFTPEEPGVDDDVVCTIDSQDPDLDGDSIRYTFGWTVDGTTSTSGTTTTHTGDTMPGSARSEGEEWVCTATPNDGDDDGASARRVLGLDPPASVDVSGTVTKTVFRRGTMTGTAYTEDCDTGEVLVGVSADLTKSGGYLAELATRCAPLTLSACDSTSCTVDTGTITTGTYRGGSGTLIQTEDCPSGSVVTGFVGRAGWFMDQIQVRCRPVSVTFDGIEWSASLGSATDLTAIGGSGGSPYGRADCASDQIASGAVIGARTSEIEGFQLSCQDVDLVWD